MRIPISCLKNQRPEYEVTDFGIVRFLRTYSRDACVEHNNTVDDRNCEFVYLSANRFSIIQENETQSLFSFLVFLCSKETKLDFNPCTLVPTDFQLYRKMKLKFYFRFSSQQKNQIGVLYSFFIFPRRKGNGIRIHLMLSVFLFLFLQLKKKKRILIFFWFSLFVFGVLSSVYGIETDNLCLSGNIQEIKAQFIRRATVEFNSRSHKQLNSMSTTSKTN